MEAQLLGSTGDSYNCSISATTKQDASLPRENEHASAQLPEATNHKESNYFRSAQWYDLTKVAVSKCANIL
jgi:hypothetical protein